MRQTTEGGRVRRRVRPAAIVVALVAALGLGFAIVAYAADPRLDEADAALQKAEALLEASQAGVVSPKVQKEFEQEVGRAVEQIDRARAHVAAAKAAVDEELGLAIAPGSNASIDGATP